MAKKGEDKKKMRTIRGKTYSRMYGPESAIGPAKERLIFPTFDIDLEYLPEARDWKNGNTYEVTLRVKQKSIREDERGGNVAFDVVGVSPRKKPIKVGKRASKEVDRRYTEEDDSDD